MACLGVCSRNATSLIQHTQYNRYADRDPLFNASPTRSDLQDQHVAHSPVQSKLTTTSLQQLDECSHVLSSDMLRDICTISHTTDQSPCVPEIISTPTIPRNVLQPARRAYGQDSGTPRMNAETIEAPRKDRCGYYGGVVDQWGRSGHSAHP
jgi:hypothetical protein